MSVVGGRRRSLTTLLLLAGLLWGHSAPAWAEEPPESSPIYEPTPLPPSLPPLAPLPSLPPLAPEPTSAAESPSSPPQSSDEPAGFHASLLGGFGFQAPFGPSFYSGFVEVRFGALFAGVELTGRLRLHAGRTDGNLTFEQLLPGIGALFKAGSRVRLGPAVNFGSLTIQRYSQPASMASATFGAYAEILVDVVHFGRRSALVLSGRAGIEVVGVSTLTASSAVVTPSALLAAGYRF